MSEQESWREATEGKRANVAGERGSRVKHLGTRIGVRVARPINSEYNGGMIENLGRGTSARALLSSLACRKTKPW